jgi:hypothetical protein
MLNGRAVAHKPTSKNVEEQKSEWAFVRLPHRVRWRPAANSLTPRNPAPSLQASRVRAATSKTDPRGPPPTRPARAPTRPRGLGRRGLCSARPRASRSRASGRDDIASVRGARTGEASADRHEAGTTGRGADVARDRGAHGRRHPPGSSFTGAEYRSKPAPGCSRRIDPIGSSPMRYRAAPGPLLGRFQVL